MTTPTSNPVPSSAPQDLLFNAEAIDAFVNSPALTVTDRRGIARATLAGIINALAALNPRGAWTTGTAYALKDVVTQGGIAYLCITAHTGGTFATDLAAGRWVVHQGLTALNGALALTRFTAGADSYQKASFGVDRAISEHAWYAFIDNSTLDYSGNPADSAGIGHATFASNVKIQGTKSFDHHHDFQAIPYFGTTGATLSRLCSFYAAPSVTGGTVTDLIQHLATNPTGSGGTITNLYGFRCYELVRGAKNWAFYSDGATPSHFGGFAESNTGFKVIKDGSDSVGAGPYIGLLNADSTRAAYQQLGASGNLDTWIYSGAAWTKQLSITYAGIATAGNTTVGGWLNVNGPVVHRAYTVATLPNAATFPYGRAFVTDANAMTFNSVVAGGGSNKMPVWSDGASWRIG